MANTMELEQGSTSSSRRISLRTISLLLVVFGLLVSGYLSYVKLTDVPMVCIEGSVFNCDVVQNSLYSTIFGIPIAWLGFGSYLLIGAFLLFENRIEFLRNNGQFIVFGLVIFSWLFSMYLIYVQAVLLQAWCQWCLLHELNITLLFVITIFRLKNFLAEPIEE